MLTQPTASLANDTTGAIGLARATNLPPLVPSSVRAVANVTYLLRLQDNCIYVGKTERTLEKRVMEHDAQNGKGAKWTRRHPIISVLAVFQTT